MSAPQTADPAKLQLQAQITEAVDRLRFAREVGDEPMATVIGQALDRMLDKWRS